MRYLNGRKASVLIVIVAVIATAVIATAVILINLSGNPSERAENELKANIENEPGIEADARVKGRMTVEDYAWQFVNDRIKEIEDLTAAGIRITESRITKLDKINSFDKFLGYPVELWEIEYSLKPEDPSGVNLAEGFEMADGWISYEHGSGKPFLVFSYKNGEPEYLGSIWDGEGGCLTVAGQEAALRNFLEGINMIPRETYPGDHILVEFPLPTGEICKLFLSQPVVKGDAGIWCVERRMDADGAIYCVSPDTEMPPDKYYRSLQIKYDEGGDPSLGDPRKVAYGYIVNELGYKSVKMEDLTVIEQASPEDFTETPENLFRGHITMFDTDTNQLQLDCCPMIFELTSETRYRIIEKGEGFGFRDVTEEKFAGYLNQHSDASPLFEVVTREGCVQCIVEQKGY